MSLLKVTGVILLVFAAIVLLCLGVIWLERRFPSAEYDERQKQAKGRASRLGFITGIIYFLVVIVILIQQVDGQKQVEPYLLVFIGILLMVTVDHTYCLVTHSALPLSQKCSWVIPSYLFCGTLHIGQFFAYMDRFGLSFVGYGSSSWIYLLSGIEFLYLALMHLIQYFRDRREGRE